MSKAAKERLMKSGFFREVRDAATECMHKWMMAKLALEHITGNVYSFTRDGETYGIVNDYDHSDMLIKSKSIRD